MNINKHRYFVGLMVMVVLAGCTTGTPVPTLTIGPTVAPRAASATAMPTVTGTATAWPTQTITFTPLPTLLPSFTLPPALTATATWATTQPPVPTATKPPTPTLVPPYSAEGPHLVYQSVLPGGGRALTLLNADGGGRKVVPLPADGYIPDTHPAISPDGQWAAYYTGSAGELGYFGPGELTEDNVNVWGPYGLTLHLMSLADGQTYTVTRILSADYPANFQRVLPIVLAEDPIWQSEGYKGDELHTLYSIERNFLSGIHRLAWSPDGQRLAFAGQMYGDTSDVYVYDLNTQAITQLTVGIGQTGMIEWSPDGRWILHTSDNNPVITIEYIATNYYVVRPDGSQVNDLGKHKTPAGWQDSQNYLVFNEANGMGQYQLSSLNVETGQQTVLWLYCFDSFALDPTGLLAVSGGGGLYFGEEPAWGSYLVYPDGREQLIVPGDHWMVIYRGIAGHRFVASSGREEKTIGYDENGVVTDIADFSGGLSVSPDRKWLLIANVLFDENDSRVRGLSGLDVRTALWRPDSVGVFSRWDAKLFYTAIPDGQTILVDTTVAPSEYDRYWDISFAWVR
jgi:Tol biopolymer transport system component